MDKITPLLEEVALHLSSLAEDAEVLKTIEQTLSDVVLSLEALKPMDPSAIVAAIKGLRLTVNVEPTPVHVHVAPATVKFPPAPAPRPFPTLKMKVTAWGPDGRIEDVEIYEKGAA